MKFVPGVERCEFFFSGFAFDFWGVDPVKPYLEFEDVRWVELWEFCRDCYRVSVVYLNYPTEFYRRDELHAVLGGDMARQRVVMGGYFGER